MTKPRRQPITKRFPDQWCFKGKVWTPSRASFEYEGSLPDEVGEFIMLMLVLAFTHKKLLTEGVRGALKKAGEFIGKEMNKIGRPSLWERLMADEGEPHSSEVSTS